MSAASSPLVRAFAVVGTERTAADSVRKLVRNADGTPLSRAEAVALVRAVRAEVAS